MKSASPAWVGAAFLFMAALVAMGGCGEADETPSDEPASETPSDDQASGQPSGPETVASDPYRTGIWTVVAHHIPGVSALNEADARAWHGRTVRLTASQALSHGSHCDEPTYTTRTVTRDGYLGGEFNLPPGAVEPLASREELTLLEISCGRGAGATGRGARWTAMGGLLIEVDEDRVLAPWDGVFFELERDRDFRALGQEPFWQLEIRKGEEIHFTHDLGRHRAVTPAPVPDIEAESGASVYNAVTEANDLRVLIEPTPCTDVMSGKPFEATVSVTLNGTDYHGCGEAME